MNIIEVKNLCVFYRVGNNSKSVLKNVSISIGFGEYVSVVGKNGAGKSTLVKAILGLVKVSSGEILFSNGSKSYAGYVPQFSTAFFSIPSTVKEIILSGILRSKSWQFFYSKSDKEILFKLSGMLKIENLLSNRLCELSGGQLKKVLLARALVSQPRILILDEPCANLDEEFSIEFNKILCKLNQESGITILTVTHDSKCASKVSDKIIKIENGSAIHLVDNSKVTRAVHQSEFRSIVC